MTDPNLYLQESGWEELRKEARKIEGDLDVKLSSYAKLGTRFTQGGLFFVRALLFYRLISISLTSSVVFSAFGSQVEQTEIIELFLRNVLSFALVIATVGLVNFFVFGIYVWIWTVLQQV